MKDLHETLSTRPLKSVKNYVIIYIKICYMVYNILKIKDNIHEKIC